MKLSRKTKLRIAGIIATPAFLLLIAEPIDETDIITLLWTKAISILILSIVAYIFNKDIEENGIEE